MKTRQHFRLHYFNCSIISFIRYVSSNFLKEFPQTGILTGIFYNILCTFILMFTQHFGNMILFFVKSKSDPIPCTQLPIKAVYFRLVKVFGMLQSKSF